MEYRPPLFQKHCKQLRLTYHLSFNVEIGAMLEDCPRGQIRIGEYQVLEGSGACSNVDKRRKKKSVATLADRLIKIIDMTRDRTIPDRLVPKNCGEKRQEMPLLGQLTAAVEYIYEKSAVDVHDFDLACRRIWKERDASMCMKMQKPGALRLNNTHAGRRIEICSEFGETVEDSNDPDDDEVIASKTVWCKGIIEEIHDESGSAWVSWDAIPEVGGYPATKSLEEFLPND